MKHSQIKHLRVWQKAIFDMKHQHFLQRKNLPIWNPNLPTKNSRSPHLCSRKDHMYASNTEINANFHFSHYKYMETLSCHSNESTQATTIKNIIYIEANVMNINAKFQLHPPYSFLEEDFLIFFSKI